MRSRHRGAQKPSAYQAVLTSAINLLRLSIILSRWNYLAEKKVNFTSSFFVSVLALTDPVPLMARYFDGYN